MEAMRWCVAAVLFVVAFWLIGCQVEVSPIVIVPIESTTTIGPPSTAGPHPWEP